MGGFVSSGKKANVIQPAPAPEPPAPVATKAQTAAAMETAAAKRARRGGGYGRGLISEEEAKLLGKTSTLS